MPLELDEHHGHYQIQAYQPGRLQVQDTIYHQSLIITPDQLIGEWTPQSIDDLNKTSFELVATLKPDILLIGTGEHFTFLPIELYGDLINQGIGVEVMDTHAACRTFNALSAEHRNVAAALLIR
jgi:uncharacterized protein